MATRVWSIGVALKAALAVAAIAVLMDMGVSLAVPAVPAAPAPAVSPVAAPALDAAERPPRLRRGEHGMPALTQWCAAPSGARIVAPCSASDTSYTGLPGSYTFTVSNPTPDDIGYHAVVTCTGIPTTMCQPDQNLVYVPSDGGTTPVTVEWAVAAGQTGSISATLVLKPIAPAVDTLKGTLSIAVLVSPPVSVVVRPHAGALEVPQPAADTSYTFTVANTGNSSAGFTLGRSCGGVTCTGSIPTSIAITAHGDSTIRVPFNAGSAGTSGPVRFWATEAGRPAVTDTGTVLILPLSKAVAVSPAQESLTMPAGIDTAVTFTVTDVGHTAPVTYHLTRTCATPVTNCTGPDSVVVSALNTPVNARVAYHTASATTGGTGGVTLVASETTGPTTDRSTGFARITVPNTTDSLYATLATSPTAVERSTCLTVAAGPGAYLCGDLLLAHALPSVRSMAKARTPVLVYASQTAAAPGAAEFKLGVDVHLKSGVVAPSALTGTLTLGTLPGCAQSWTTTGWPTGGVRRVVARCTGLALSQAATALPFTLQLTATINGHLTTRSVTGTAIVLARGTSAFGAGWSLAGLEQLYFPADTTQLLWVSGDGSARIYHRLGNTNSFLADSVDGPDSLTRNPTTLTYTRFAPGGLRIHFDSAGEHATTVNRLGQTTHFYWSSGHLDSLRVPPDTAHLTWHFTYTSGHLSSVTAPPGPGGARTVTVYESQSPARLDSVKDLDARTVRFSYAGTPALLTRRIDQLHDTVTFTYGAANTLAAVTVQPDTVPAHALTTSFLPADVAGLTGGAVVDPATVVSKVITPGADTTIVSLDRFGQPLTVRDAIGETTTITRGDTRWPALATRVVAPNGYTTAAAYDGSGRLVMDTAIAPFGGSNAISSYSYENTFDEVTRVVGPTGEVWRATYDATNGERLAEAVTDTGSLYETTYRYDATCQMVRAVTAPLTPSDSVVYDTRCNPRLERSPGGAVDTIAADILGRVTHTTSPMGVVDSMTYDAMDRVLTKLTIGPARGSAPSETVAVTMAYDSVGRDTMVTRTINPDPAGISALTTRTGFDRMGRVVRETAPDSAATLTQYDLVTGDPIKVFSRLGGTRDSLAITMTYDKLHRLRSRTVPKFAYPEEDIGVYQAGSSYYWRHAYPMYPNATGQTGYSALAQVDSFVYATSGAAAGSLTHANNGDAKVTRTYYANGRVASETDSVRTLAAVGSGGDFTHHIYTETYAYDLAGRLTTLVVPPQLAPRVQTNALGSALVTGTATIAVKDTIRYAYATGAQGTGALSQVTGLLPGDVFTYHDTPRGEVDSVAALVQASGGPVPRPVQDAWSYTPDGAVLTHRTLAGTADTLRFRSVVVDSASRVVSDTDMAHAQPGLEPTGRHFLYSGLGHLLSSTYNTTSADGHTQLTATEAQAFDPLGNWTARANTASDAFQVQYGSGFSTSLTTRVARYEAATGRLRANTLGDGHVDTLLYDAAGNLHATLTTNPGNSSTYTERVSYYSLDGHLVAADARYGNTTGLVVHGHTAFEEYRYDALGRRIWTRVRRWCDDQGGGDYGDDAACEVSTVRRTVWSGAQELAEIQMPAFDSTYLNPVRTPVDTVENDTLPIHRRRNPVMPGDPYYDANRLYGRVLYVMGLATDEPLAITRMNYADASTDTGAVAWGEYAPYSILPLWNDEGRTDRAVMGGTAAPGADSLCASSIRCAYVAFDRGEFPFTRSGSYDGVWQGTLLVDKADATGTYYRRNRSYDPSTGRFTQEDPLGLAGGLNVYGFNGGDPVNFSDPFGLTPCCVGVVAVGGTEDGIVAGFAAGGPVGWFIDATIVAALVLPGNEPGPVTAAEAARSPAADATAVSSVNKRRPKHQVVREWENKTGNGWPNDPATGKPMEADHDKPLADGGSDTGDNVTPRTHTDHVNRHRENGDFGRWARRKGTGKTEPPPVEKPPEPRI